LSGRNRKVPSEVILRSKARRAKDCLFHMYFVAEWKNLAFMLNLE